MAWALAGARPELVHFSDLLRSRRVFGDFAAIDVYRWICLRGSHDLRPRICTAGQAPAERELEKFIHEGKLILGACNGFQIMVKLGCCPDGQRITSLRLCPSFRTTASTFQDVGFGCAFFSNPLLPAYLLADWILLISRFATAKARYSRWTKNCCSGWRLRDACPAAMRMRRLESRRRNSRIIRMVR